MLRKAQGLESKFRPIHDFSLPFLDLFRLEFFLNVGVIVCLTKEVPSSVRSIKKELHLLVDQGPKVIKCLHWFSIDFCFELEGFDKHLDVTQYQPYYVYLEPICPLFLGLNPPKEGTFQSKQWSFWALGTCKVRLRLNQYHSGKTGAALSSGADHCGGSPVFAANPLLRLQESCQPTRSPWSHQKNAPLWDHSVPVKCWTRPSWPLPVFQMGFVSLGFRRRVVL